MSHRRSAAIVKPSLPSVCAEGCYNISRIASGENTRWRAFISL